MTQGRIGSYIFIDNSSGSPQTYNEIQIADGISNTYYLANSALPGSIRAHVNGIRHPISDDTSATDTVTFSDVPASGDVLMFDYELELASS